MDNKDKTSKENLNSALHKTNVMWRLSSIVLVPIVFFVLFFVRPIKWIFTGYYYPKDSRKAKKTLLYKWISKTGLSWIR